MKAHIRALVLTCVVPIVFSGCCTTRGQNQAWEYKVLRLHSNGPNFDPNARLNELAQQGWVLVSGSVALVKVESGDIETDLFVLKRPRK